MAAELNTDGLENALIILGAAGIVIPAFARLRITPIIGFLLVGVLVGPMGLGSLTGDYPWLKWITIYDTEGVDRVGEFGIILLLFGIGLELSFRRLWRMRKQVFGLGAAELFGGALLIGGALFAFGYSPTEAAGLGLALSILFIRFDDTRNIVNVLLMILMYLTPIFYPVSVMNTTMQNIIRWNPRTSYLEIFRWAFSNNAFPSARDWIFMIVTSLFSLWLGTYVFKKYWPRTVAML